MTHLLALALILGAGDITEAIRKDKAALQGVWQIVGSERNGEKVPEADLKGLALVFRGDAILVREGGKASEKFTYLLDPLKKPRAIDLEFVVAPNKGRIDRAIYALDGDRLRICIQENKDSPRPTDFSAPSGSNRSLVILQRTKD